MNDVSPSAAPAAPARVFGEIPAWTLSGVLPPYLDDPRLSLNMAPYPTTLENLVERFAFTPRRREILHGLLRYRQALADLRIVSGFQWLNGSILEDIENLESREPKDIDIITFFHRPVGATDPIAWEHFTAANRALFIPSLNKTAFKCDTQYIDLDSSTEDVANLTRFWFGLFSHRRNHLWKGMLTVPLAISVDDNSAQTILASKEPGTGHSSRGSNV